MEIREIKKILELGGFSEETKAAIEEVVGVQEEGELEAEKERAVRKILEVELEISDLQAEISEKFVGALDDFSKNGNAVAVEEIIRERKELESRIGQKFSELKALTRAQLDSSISD